MADSAELHRCNYLIKAWLYPSVTALLLSRNSAFCQFRAIIHQNNGTHGHGQVKVILLACVKEALS